MKEMVLFAVSIGIALVSVLFISKKYGSDCAP